MRNKSVLLFLATLVAVSLSLVARADDPKEVELRVSGMT